MKRRIFSAVLVIAMLLSFAVIGSAKTYGLVFDSTYDAEENIVSVTIYIEAPGALESADFCVAYEPAVYEYVDYSDEGTSSDLITAIGKSTLDEGLVTCSAMFTEHCKEEDLDENGNLMLATFNFRPVSAEYDIENFCMWANSYYINDTDIVSAVVPVGNTALKENHTVVVTVSPTTSSSSAKKDSEGNSKWYIYVIASVIAVGAVAGIAVIAIKNNQEQDEEKPENGKDRKKEEKELKENTGSSDE